MFVTLELSLPDTCEPGRPHPQNKTSFTGLGDKVGGSMFSKSATGQPQPGTAFSTDEEPPPSTSWLFVSDPQGMEFQIPRRVC